MRRANGAARHSAPTVHSDLEPEGERRPRQREWTVLPRRTAVLAIALVAASLLAACSGGQSPPVPAPPASLGTVLDSAVPVAVLDAPLTTPQGTPTSLRAYAGRVLVLTDFLTLCSEICPITTGNMVEMARQAQAGGLGGKVAFVELTVDPERDTPARLAAYRKFFANPPADWQVLTAPASSLTTIWRHFGVSYERQPQPTPPATDWLTHQPLTYDVGHLDAVVYLDGAQHERFLITGNPNGLAHPPPSALASTLSEQGRANLNHPDPGMSWTVDQGLQPVSWLTGRQLKPH